MKQYKDVTFDFTGKVAVVTGGSSGIFQGVARGLGQAGAKVAIVDIADCSETIKMVEDGGSEAKAYTCNVADTSQIVATVKQIIADFGKIDILVNGAGILRRAKAEEIKEEEWQLVLDVQLNGTFFMCREVGRHMIERGEGGKIVNCSSMNAFFGGYTVASYSAAKAGITQMTKGLCNEWAVHGINVNAVAPGWFVTQITRPVFENPERGPGITKRIPAGHWGDPEEMAGPVLCLCSEAADYLHGVILPVDGGFLCM